MPGVLGIGGVSRRPITAWFFGVTSMKITINIREVYGVAKAYPVCDKAKLFARIAGTTTLTSQTLALVAKLGYEVELVNNLKLELVA